MSRSVGRGAAVMMAGTGTSKVLGQVRNLVLIWLIGQTSTAADAFTLANNLPTVLYGLLVSGTLSAVLVPQIVRAYQRGAGQEYVNRVLSLGLVVVAVMTVVLTAAVPLVVALYGQGPDRNRLGLAVAFAWWTMPQVFFYSLYALLGQVLNARGSFGPFAWAPVANSVVAIATFVVFAARYGAWQDHPPQPQLWTPGQVAVLAGGATLGIAVQALVLVPALRRAGVDYRFRWSWRGVGLRAAGGTAWWTFLALLVGQVGFVVVSRVAAVMALVGLRRRLGPVRGSAILRTYLRATVAVVVATGTGWAVLAGLRAVGLADQAGWGGWAKAVALCVLVGSAVAGVYLTALRWLRVREIGVLVATVRRLRGAY